MMTDVLFVSSVPSDFITYHCVSLNCRNTVLVLARYRSHQEWERRSRVGSCIAQGNQQRLRRLHCSWSLLLHNILSLQCTIMWPYLGDRIKRCIPSVCPSVSWLYDLLGRRHFKYGGDMTWVLVVGRENLRSKGQVTGNENVKSFSCISSWKVHRFTSNQDQHDVMSTPHFTKYISPAETCNSWDICVTVCHTLSVDSDWGTP